MVCQHNIFLHKDKTFCMYLNQDSEKCFPNSISFTFNYYLNQSLLSCLLLFLLLSADMLSQAGVGSF